MRFRMRNKMLLICATLIMSSFSLSTYNTKASELEPLAEESVMVEKSEEVPSSKEETLSDTNSSEDAEAVKDGKTIVEDVKTPSPEKEEDAKAEILKEDEETIKEETNEEIKEETEKEAEEEIEKPKAKKKKKKKKKSIIQYTDEEFKILVCTMFAEGGNQPYKAKLCYANAILNRVKQKNFPDTIRGVIYHTLTSKSGKKVYQFGLAKPGGTLEKHLKLYGKRKHPLERKNEKECIKAAKAALLGENPLGDYAFFASANAPIRYQQTDGIQVNGAYFYNYHWKPWKKKK